MKKCLIIVDMQNDFIDGSLANPDAQAIVDPICDEILKGEYDKIIMTRDTHDFNYLKTPEGINLPIEHCIEGTAGWCVNEKILKTVRTSGKEFQFINKNTFGYIDWQNTRFGPLSYLASEGRCPMFTAYEEIYLVGTCTDICVLSNAIIIKNMLPNSKIKVISSLCAGLSKQKHEAALESMTSCQIEVI